MSDITIQQPRALTAEELEAASAEPFLPDDPDGLKFLAELEAAAKKAAREERVLGHQTFAEEQEEGRRRARAALEAAELDGQLAPDAEAFRDIHLKPKIKSAHDFEPKVRTPIVQGLFFRDSLTWVAGSSGTFKSFITADLAFRYGAGLDFHGKRMTKGRALLVVAEGAAAYADRKTAWEKHHGRTVENVDIYPAPLQLGDTLKEMPALISYLKECEAAEEGYGLILFDTQAMCTVGMDENSSEMNLVVNVLHRIREVSGACVMVVHHFGKQKGAGMRGSSMIYAAADTVCILNRKEDAMDVVISTAQADGGKQKDAIAEKDILTFDMKAYPVGEDFFGDAVFSLVPVAVDGGSVDVSEAPDTAPLDLPGVTDIQLYYLRGIGTYEAHGAAPASLRERLLADDYLEAPPKGHVVDRQTPGNRMQDLSKKGLTEPVPGRKGWWKITPLGLAVVVQDRIDRGRVEQMWTERKARRGPVRGLVQGASEPELPNQGEPE